MLSTAPRTPESVETEARRAWRKAGVPPARGPLGPADGPLVRQVLGGYAPGDSSLQTVARAVRADVEARYLILAGHKVVGVHRAIGERAAPATRAMGELLSSLGVWTGGSAGTPLDDSERTGRIQLLVERLALSGILVVRDGAVRLCTHCGAPRSPERTVYQEEVGDSFLVRFPLGGEDPPGELLAWVDAPWRLLGATALLVNPEMKYVTVEYRRDGGKARLVLARSALGRLEHWILGGKFDLVGELVGRELDAVPFAHPLRHESPGLGALLPPAGTVRAVAEVGDSGTGVVPLVPRHGGSDHHIAERLKIDGPSLLTGRGQFDRAANHKYAGLELETANGFVLRDLNDSGSVVARLRVLRGVPHCGVCGRPMVWVPGRAWRLDLSKMPEELSAQYARFLPSEPAMNQLELSPWPASETAADDGPGSFRLSECDRCDRLGPPDQTGTCRCGGGRTRVARHLLPSILGALGAWAARETEVKESERRLYVSERRRAPSLVHHLVALASLEETATDLHLTVVPTLPDADPGQLEREHGADALRAALLRAERLRGYPATLSALARQEKHRYSRLLALADAARASSVVANPRAPAAVPEIEERMLLARWWQVEDRVRTRYENGDPVGAYRELSSFLDRDLELYRRLVLPPHTAPPPASILLTASVLEVLRRFVELLAPVAPFTAEAIHRALDPASPALFAGTPLEVDHPPPDPELLARWPEWLALLGTLARFRAAHRIPPEAILPRVVLVVDDEATGRRLRSDRGRLEAVARLGRFEVGSPEQPWGGRVKRVVPVEEEVAKAYPAIAPQVLHLLRRLPPRGAAEGDPLRGVSVVVGGLPRPISPNMLTVEEELPSGYLGFPCSLGELLVQPPSPDGATTTPPVLSPDAGWLVQRIGQRLRAARRNGFDASDRAVVVHAPEALAVELRDRLGELAAELRVREVRVEPPEEGAGLPVVYGRTRTGNRWWAEIPGLSVPPRPAKSRARGPNGRVPVLGSAEDGTEPEIDYLAPELIEREEGVRKLCGELEELLGAAAIGPTKGASAWAAGFRTPEQLVEAPFEVVAHLPGFGRPIATVLFEKSGRDVPPALAETTAEQEATAAHVVRIPKHPVSPPDSGGAGPESSLETPATGTFPEDPAADRDEAPPLPSGPSSPREESGFAGSPAGPAPAALPPRSAGDERSDLGPAASPGAPTKVSERDSEETTVGVLLDTTESPTASLLPFLEATAAGEAGLAIARGSYARLQSVVGTRSVRVRRLQEVAGGADLAAADLAGLGQAVAEAIHRGGVRAVYLEGIDFLVETHGLDAVVHLLREVDAAAAAAAARVWVHVDEAKLLPEEAERLRQAFPSDLDWAG